MFQLRLAFNSLAVFYSVPAQVLLYVLPPRLPFYDGSLGKGLVHTIIQYASHVCLLVVQLTEHSLSECGCNKCNLMPNQLNVSKLSPQHAVMDTSTALCIARPNIVHTSSDCSILLAGK